MKKSSKTTPNPQPHPDTKDVPQPEAETPTPTTIPENFEKIITDMTNDLSTTFPEYSYLWEKWTKQSFDFLESSEKEKEIEYLYEYCKMFYADKFFDILYYNEELFNLNNDKNAFFLPGVDFKLLFHCNDISENTRKIMWNYLQLILITIVSSIETKEGFGETTKQLFEGINETDLYSKLNETIESMGEFFQSINLNDENTGNEGEAEGCGNDTTNDDDAVEDDDDEDTEDCFDEKMKGLPNVKDLYGHLKTLFDGKIGSLAKELAEEISKDVNGIFGENTNENETFTTKDIIQTLLKNPEKMSGLIKTVSDKLNEKITSGDISKDELLKEATDILGKMKGMGDKKQFQEMFKNLSKMTGLGGKNTKFDMNAFQQMSKQSSTRERLKERMMKKKAQEALLLEKIKQHQIHNPTEEFHAPPDIHILPTEKPNNYKFTINEDTPTEYTSIAEQPTNDATNNATNDATKPVKKNKKNKSKK